MNTWTRQKGFPVVTLKKSSAGYTLSQERFLADPDAKSEDDAESEFGYKWEVPITYVTSENPKERKLVWMHADGKDINM